MFNYFSLLWGGAMLHPTRWLYALHNKIVVLGLFLVALLCCLGHFPMLAGALLALTLFYWGYHVCKPDQRYIMQLNSGGRLHLLVFHTGMSRKFAKPELRTALLHVFVSHDKSLKLRQTIFCFGYDISLRDVGLFLYKTDEKNWSLISAQYPSGILLGHHVAKNVYSDDGALKCLHENIVVELNAGNFRLSPLGLAYDGNKAHYKPLGDKADFSELKSHLLLMALTNNCAKLYAFGITEDNVPLIFQVFVPYVYPNYCPYGYDNGILPISVNPDDGSFVFF